MTDSNWVICINYVLLHLSGCIIHPDNNNMMGVGWRVIGTQESDIAFFSQCKQREESYKLQFQAPIFLNTRSHQSRAKESRPTPLSTSPLSHHWLQCFPLSICHKCTRSIIPTALWTSRSPSMAPAYEQDTRYLFITPSLEEEKHKSIQPLSEELNLFSQQKSHSVR